MLARDSVPAENHVSEVGLSLDIANLSKCR